MSDALIVSGSDVIRQLTEMSLGPWGELRFRVAADRHEAVHLMGTRVPDLVIVDWDAPDASVVAAAAHGAGVRFVTVNDDAAVARRGGAFACVPSPFSATKLSEALQDALGATV